MSEAKNDLERTPGTHWNDEEIELAQRVLAIAESVQSAAEELGVSTSSLRKAFRRRELPSPSEFIETSTPTSCDDDDLEVESLVEVKHAIRVHDSERQLYPSRSLSNRKHLVIGDAHAKPGTSNDRFDWLGQLIYDEEPDVVICIGDFADCPSLSSYDKGRKSFEGRRYRLDVEATIDAQEKMFKWINRMERRPRMVHCLGNHDEGRIKRVTQSSPEFDGLISIDDFKYREFGWEVYPFLDRVVVDGIAYSHYFTSGIMGRPIGGENAAATLIKKQYMSCTAGHSHFRDFAERTRADGKKMMGLVTGCFFEHSETYAGVGGNSLWWRGIVVKDYVRDGEYEPRWIPIEAMKEKYSC